MRHGIAVLLCLAISGAAAAAAEDPPAAASPGALTLRIAASQGLVKGAGESPSGYHRVFLRLQNVSDRPLAVDLCGNKC